MTEPTLSNADALLTRYLDSSDPLEEAQLRESLALELRGIVSKVLGFRFGRGERERIEDACQECLLSLFGKIQRLKENPTEAPVQSLSAYAATAAQNAFRGQLRRQNPEERLDQMASGEIEQLPDPGKNVEDFAVESIHREELLRRGWQEICHLPLRQRTALVLSLPPDAFLVYRLLIGPEAICECLQLSRMEIDELPARLPVSDTDLAQAMGLQRQQVINLRLSARQRLARKLSR